MDFVYGIRSMAKLSTCHHALQRIMRRAIAMSPVDILIICGHRTEEEQNAAFAKGTSKVRWPKGKHNTTPSDAVDWAPYIHGAVPWNDVGAFYMVAGVVLAAAKLEGISVRYGGDWDRDGETRDNRFQDLGHIERIEVLDV